MIVVGAGLLISTLGISAVVGLGLMILAAPLQGIMFKYLLNCRMDQEKAVDHRTGLLTEVINNIRAVKLYAYESFFSDKIQVMRHEERRLMNRYALIRTSVGTTFAIVPLMATICELTQCAAALLFDL